MSLDADIRMDLDYILQRNLKQIIAKYASFVDCLRAVVIEKGVTSEELRSYLSSLSAFSCNKDGQRLYLLSDKKHKLREANTITDIFTFLSTECASFLNYDIFERIMHRYKIDDNQEQLKYRDHLEVYVNKHKISEFEKINSSLRKSATSKKLIVKFDIEITCRLAKIIDLKKTIAEILDVTPSALQIVDIEEGCIVLTFHVSASIADALFSPDTVLTPQQEENFRATSVLWLTCNNYTFHFEREKIKETKSQGINMTTEPRHHEWPQNVSVDTQDDGDIGCVTSTTLGQLQGLGLYQKFINILFPIYSPQKERAANLF